MQNHFTETIFYQIELTAKYCKLLGSQVFEKFNEGITCEEYSVLDSFLLTNPFFSSVSSNLPVLALSFKISLAKSLWHNSGLLSKTSNTEYSSQMS